MLGITFNEKVKKATSMNVLKKPVNVDGIEIIDTALI